jgi:hypothetical protein
MAKVTKPTKADARLRAHRAKLAEMRKQKELQKLGGRGTAQQVGTYIMYAGVIIMVAGIGACFLKFWSENFQVAGWVVGLLIAIVGFAIKKMATRG